MNKKTKTSYMPPQIEVFHIEMEHSIAAASVGPLEGSAEQVWETETDDNRELEWDYQL